MGEPLVSDAQRAKIEPLLPKPKRRRRGRPPKPNHVVFEAILWILRSGLRVKEYHIDVKRSWELPTPNAIKGM